MGVRMQTTLLQALSFVDAQISSADFEGPTRAHLEEEVEGAVTKPLLAVLRDLLRILLYIIGLESTDVVMLEKCCRLIGQLTERYDTAYNALLELGAPEVLAHIVRTHPENFGIVKEAMWPLAYLKGAVAVAHVLNDSELSAKSCVVRAAVRTLSRLPDCRYPDVEGALRWSDRLKMAQVVVTTMLQHPGDGDLRSFGCSALGSLLSSWAPDVVHTEAASVLPIIFEAMRADPSCAELQASAAYAISHIVPGNAPAAAFLKAEENVAVLSHVMLVHSKESRIRQSLAKILACTEGLTGVIHALSRFDDASIHSDILWSYTICFRDGNVDDTADTVVRLNAIRHISESMNRWGRSVRYSAVTSIGSLVLLLLGDMQVDESVTTPHMNAVENGFDAMVEALHASDGSAAMRSEVFEGLANAALQGEWARRTLRGRSRLTEALGWWRRAQRLDQKECTLSLFLAAALEGSAEPILQSVDEYPDWYVLHQAACSALERFARAVEGEQVFTCMAAVRVCGYASDAIQRYPHSHMRCAAAGVLGCLLPVISKFESVESSVFRRGCDDLLKSVRYLHRRSLGGTGFVVQAVAAVALESPPARAVLRDLLAVDVLAEVIKTSAASAGTNLLAEALLALGLLGGAQLVCEAMSAFPNLYWLQVSGCMALADLARANVISKADLASTSAAVEYATNAFKSRANSGALHCHAVLSMKLLEVAATPVG